jgi:hypothetical protein
LPRSLSTSLSLFLSLSLCLPPRRLYLSFSLNPSTRLRLSILCIFEPLQR